MIELRGSSPLRTAMNTRTIRSIQLTIAFFSLVTPVMAQEAGIPLDLSSGERNLVAPTASGAATILTASGEHHIQPGDALTAAQYAAYAQVAAGGQQTLQVGAGGQATGGTVMLAGLGGLSSLNVPTGVTAVGVLNSGALNITGSLINNGLLVALPGTSSVSNLQVSAASIFNGSTGTITTSVPAQLAAIFSSTSPVNLQLISGGNFTNLGNISASGNLSIVAGGSIVNSGTITGNLSAVLSSITGSITNQGIISSTLGNVALSTVNPVDLLVNNTRGLITGSNIDFNSTGSLVSVLGGTLSATQNVNFNARDGVVRAMLDEVRGTVNVTACESHLSVNGGQLNIGSVDLSGDPTFVNSGGDIVLNPNAPGGVLSFAGENLAVLAAGSVLPGGGLTAIDLSAPNGGGNLFISAGLTVDQDTAGFTVSEPPSAPVTWTLGAPSATGGSVLLPGITLNTSSSAPNSKAGNITVIAHDNDNLNAGGVGQVKIGAVNASSAAGTGGNILIVAQAGPLSLLSPITADGGVSPGNLEIYTGEPESKSLSFFDGAQKTGTVAVKANGAHELVSLGLVPIGTTFRNVTISASGQVIVNGVLRATEKANITSRGSNVGLAGGVLALQDVAIVSAGDTSINFVTTLASGGNLTIKAQSIYDFGGSLYASTGGSTNLIASGDLYVGASKFLSAGNINLGGNYVELGSGAAFTSFGSLIAVSGTDLLVAPAVTVNAGQLQPGAPAGLLAYSDIKSYGGAFLVAENNLQLGSSLTANGLDIVVVARTGDLLLDPALTFTANGGNIVMVGGGKVTGSNETFISRAAGHFNNFGGGVIEVSAGIGFNPVALGITADANANNQQLQLFRSDILTAANAIARFAGQPTIPFTSPALDGGNNVADPLIMGALVNINNNGINTGLVNVTKIGGGAVNVAGSQLSLQKGAILLDAVGAGSLVSLPGSQFQTQSYNVLSSDFDANLSTQVVQALNGIGFGEAGFQLPSIYSRDISINVNLAEERLMQLNFMLTQPSSYQRDTVQQRSIEVLAGLLNGSRGGGVDTGKTEYVRVSSVRIVNSDMASAAGGSRGQEPLNIVRDNGAVMPVVKVGERRNDLVLFTSAGQVLTGSVGGSKGGTAVGSRGTTVSNERNALILHGGRIYADSGAGPMKVSASFGNIVLSPGTTAAIVSDQNGEGRLVVLGGGTDANLVFTPTGTSEQITLKPGEEASIRLEGEAGSVDKGATRMVVVKAKVAVAMLMEAEQFYSSRSIRLGGGVRPAYERMIDRINHWVVPVASAASGSSSVFDPGFPAQLLASPGTLFQQGKPGEIIVKNGRVLTHARVAHTIRTSRADVVCTAGSNTAVIEDDKQSRVLSFSGPGHATASIDQKKLVLQPGQELLVQIDRPTKSEALPDDGIARRSLTNFAYANKHMVLGDFSIISALQNCDYLKPLRSGLAHKEVQSGMLKTAACITTVLSYRGQYYMQPAEKTYVPPDLIRSIPDAPTQIALKSDSQP